MKKLPKEVWLIDPNKEINSPFLSKFMEWISERTQEKVCEAYKYYGWYYGKFGAWFTVDDKKIITLQEWHDCVFGEQFKKGEEVLVRSNKWIDDDDWVKAIFISEYNEHYVVDWNGDVSSFDQCKKNPSELDIKIEELKKFAEEKGVKLTIICE